jgi:hypothetical protein
MMPAGLPVLEGVNPARAAGWSYCADDLLGEAAHRFDAERKWITSSSSQSSPAACCRRARACIAAPSATTLSGSRTAERPAAEELADRALHCTRVAPPTITTPSRRRPSGCIAQRLAHRTEGLVTSVWVMLQNVSVSFSNQQITVRQLAVIGASPWASNAPGFARAHLQEARAR